MLSFTKMHGLGNDFVVINDTTKQSNLTPDLIKRMAHRHTGIGFDQLLLIQSPTCSSHDYVYRIFNANGQEVEQCGNGARCVAYYLFSRKMTTKDKIILATAAGAIELQRESNDLITVNMGPPEFSPEKIPFITNESKLSNELQVNGQQVQFGVVSMGNPHAVLRVQKIEQAQVTDLGAAFQRLNIFPHQVNVGFMEIVSKDYIRLRVYERGVGETLACGTGACAAVVIGRLIYALSDRVTVELPGGLLQINWQGADSDVFMTGPAEVVFEGEYYLPHH